MLHTKVNSCLCLTVCCISSRTGIPFIINYFSVPKVTAEVHFKALMALLAFSFLHPLLPSQLPSILLPWDYIRQLKRPRWWKSTRQYTRRWKHEESWKSLAEHHFNLFVLWEAYIMSSTKLSYLWIGQKKKKILPLQKKYIVLLYPVQLLCTAWLYQSHPISSSQSQL